GHLLAISGLHVGIAALIFAAIIRRVIAFWRPRRIAWGAALELAPVVLVIVAYVLATGGAASAVRAGIMAMSACLGRVAGRPIHRPTVLLGTAASMCAWRPEWLFDPSFQLSFAALIAISRLPPG